jgi:hypothetical protein
MTHDAADGLNSDCKRLPDDFPRGGMASTLPGAQPKLNAQKVNGKFVVGYSQEELRLRYTLCQEYVDVLPAHCMQMRQQKIGMTEEVVLERTGRALAHRHWQLSGAEVDWVIGKVAEILGWDWRPSVLWRSQAKR